MPSEHLLLPGTVLGAEKHDSKQNKDYSSTTFEFIPLCLFHQVLTMLLQGKYHYLHFIDGGTRDTEVKAKVLEPVDSKGKDSKPLELIPKLVFILLDSCHCFGSMQIKENNLKTIFKGFTLLSILSIVNT